MNFEMDMNFSKHEIAQMLRAYETDVHTGMDVESMADLLYEDTSGYPFLVSRLCKIMDEELPRTAEFSSALESWSREGFLAADRMIEIYLYNRLTKNYLYITPKML